jgi:hypothetical protein
MKTGFDFLQLLEALVESIKQSPLQKTVKANITWPVYENNPATSGKLTQDYLWLVSHRKPHFKHSLTYDLRHLRNLSKQAIV